MIFKVAGFSFHVLSLLEAFTLNKYSPGGILVYEALLEFLSERQLAS